MTPANGERRTRFLAAAVLQIGCGAIFLFDVIAELSEMTTHTWVEAGAVVALALGAGINLSEYASLLRRNRRIETALDAASGGFQASIERHFDEWGLTRAERDVALLSIKGVPIREIAPIRSTKRGTIKAQNASIYKKANISSRAELVSVVIEDLIAGESVLVDDDKELNAAARLTAGADA